MTNQHILKIDPIDDYLVLYFCSPWEQEDLTNLTELLFSGLNSSQSTVQIQERILGADRENVRFCWQSHYFILNFDCCSQSCWIEGQDLQSTENLPLLFAKIKNHVGE